MRRPLVALAVAIVTVGLFTGGLAWLLDTPKARRARAANSHSTQK
jgi:hypothetical protein